MEGPAGTWTAGFASPIFDEPAGLLWDTPGLLVVRYGFVVYALSARTGELRWTWDSGTPVVAVLGSSRLGHVIAQSEVETVALDATGGRVARRALRRRRGGGPRGRAAGPVHLGWAAADAGPASGPDGRGTRSTPLGALWTTVDGGRGGPGSWMEGLATGVAGDVSSIRPEGAGCVTGGGDRLKAHVT